MRWLPEKLPEKREIVWRRSLTSPGLAGVSATRELVIATDRDSADSQDIFRAFDSQTGEEIWTYAQPALGRLDYGNSPRAAPLIHGDSVFLQGAFGDLACLNLESGDLRWRLNFRRQFRVRDKLVWGTCSSPLIVDGQLIVNPGARDASLVALDPESGEVRWKSPGDAAAFASFVVGELGGVRQLVGYDKKSLGGWATDSGKRLWRLVPPVADDFNVPTPVVYQGQLLVTTENNGTRLYGFREGRIVEEPLAINQDLAPDSHSPVVAGSRVFGLWGGLHCLDLSAALTTVWHGHDKALEDYGSLVATEERVLAIGHTGELILVDANVPQFEVNSRLAVFDDDRGVYSHPAFIDRWMYLRGTSELICLNLDG